MVKNKVTFTVVGIGASAGGLEAMSRLLEALPAADTGMAFVLVQHLSPTHESVLAGLLSKKTSIRVHEATNNAQVEPGNLYVIPPDTSMVILDGILKLTPRDKTESIHHPIDVFFSSLAESHGAKAVGIVLSGTATDGTLGLENIKAEGGVTMAQDQTAKYYDMPRNAITSGAVDYVSSPEGIAHEIVRISKHSYTKAPAIVAKNLPLDTLKKIIFILQRDRSIDFTGYKQPTIRRRVMRRIMLTRTKDIEEYAANLADNPAEQDALYQDLLISVTSFFRDPEALKALKNTVLPALLKDRQPTDPLRVWVAGCATGEEAYSLAMVLLEALDSRALTIPVQIFATDVNPRVIAHARRGIYSKNACANVSPQRRKHFFDQIDGGYQVSKRLREMCVFATHNFLKDVPFSRLDIISCQNVLIYLGHSLQNKSLSAFYYGLKPKGFLVLGKAEATTGAQDLFAQLDKDHRIYIKKESSSRVNLGIIANTPLGVPRLLQGNDSESEARSIETTIEKEADRLLLSRYVPASVIVNADLEILQFRGKIGEYLQPASGRASLSLLNMVADELEFELKSIITRAKRLGMPVKRDDLHVRLRGIQHSISLEVIPIKSILTSSLTSGSTGTNFLIIFTNTAEYPAIPIMGQHTTEGADKTDKIEASDKTQDTYSVRDAREKRIIQLEQNQFQMREQMKSMREEYEAANEELQSASEEVLSSNEELQSVNEEMETSREELQSTNEELTTVNDELTNRNADLRESRDYSEAIISTVRESLVVLNRELRVRTANKSFYKTFQTNPDDTEGRSIYELGSGQWDIQRLRELLTDIFANRGLLLSAHGSASSPNSVAFEGFVDFEVKYFFPSIGERVMLLNARGLQSKDSQDTSILLAIEDITERRRSEEALRQSLQYRDEFIGIASHELKTPVTSAKAYAQILKSTSEKTGEAESAALAGRLNAQLDKLTTLIGDLLDITKLGAGKLQFRPSYFDFNGLVEDTVEDLLQTIQSHHIVTKLAPTKMIYGDRERIGQAITNFLTNAVKYSPSAKEVTVTTTSDAKTVSLCVQDSGIGMSKKDQANVFERFYRASGRRQAAYPGLGLGLYIASEIISRQNGRIWVESKKGKGSSFYFSLPIQNSQLQDIQPQQKVQKGKENKEDIHV